MTVEMTLGEAEILIAILTGAEGSFAVTNPPLVEALRALRPMRTALMMAYLRTKAGMDVLPDTDKAEAIPARSKERQSRLEPGPDEHSGIDG